MGAVFAKYYNFSERNNCRSRAESSKATPKRKIIIDDPRSPTNEISRTPIQVETSSKTCMCERKISPLALSTPPGAGVERQSAVQLRGSDIVKFQRVVALQMQERDPRSPSFGIERTPIQVPAGENEGVDEQPVEQVQEILLYEEGTEVPLVKNSPSEAANPSCARIMGLPPQGMQVVGDGQPQLDTDMAAFLSGLSKGLALTETQKQKVMRTYRDRENSVRVKKLQTAKQMPTDDDTPPPRARVPLGDFNSMHHVWRGRSGKEDHRGLSLLSENTAPGSLHDASKVHAVWDQDATVVI